MDHPLRFVARERFEHAGNVVWPFQEYDPRVHRQSHSDVHLDLRKCQFVMPPAVLWCTIFGLLSKQADNECILLVPENDAVCRYLKSLGLLGIAKQHGLLVDDRDIPISSNLQVLLPLTRFDTESQAEALANKALETLEQSGYGSANLYPVVSEVFAELAMNAVQHSESSIGAYGLVQFYEGQGGRRFVGSVADGGIGIRRTVSNQQKWDTLGAERSGAGWRSGELPEGPVVASSPFGGLSLHLLPAL